MPKRKIRNLPYLLLLCWAILLPCDVRADGVEIVYLGNEGFLLKAGEQQVLIDALFGDGLRGYPVVPKQLRRSLEDAEGAYAEIDLVLASHFHPDHFDAAAVARHLEANPGARFISTQQAARKVLATGVAPARVTGFWPPEGAREQVEEGGVRVTAFRLHHGDSPAQNLGLLVDIGGVRVLHMGDTEVTADQLRRLALDKLGIDVALVPYWYFVSRHFIPALDEVIASHLVAMHFPAVDAPLYVLEGRGDLAIQIAAGQKRRPDAWMAVEPGDSRRFVARPNGSVP